MISNHFFFYSYTLLGENMIKKYIKVIGLLFLVGFSFFYTEKVTKIVRQKDPIMIKINNIKKESSIDVIKPIINNDEYIMGINGCEIDIDKSYDKMKTVKEFKKELLVMKEVKNDYSLKDKYIVGANRLDKNMSLIFLIKDTINEDLINYLNKKKVEANFFVDHKFLEDNTNVIKFISENNNIYYLGDNLKYKEEYMIYSSNLIGINSNNDSEFCLLENKDEDTLKLCSEYNMKTIKTNVIRDNILSNVKDELVNGSIITIDSSDTEKVKVSINYILSKGLI